MTKEAYFEKLSYALRRRELLPRPIEEDGLLPVELFQLHTVVIEHPIGGNTTLVV